MPFDPTDSDWREAFDAAYDGVFTIEDVVSTIASVDGENDGDSWVWLGRLKPKSEEDPVAFGYLAAWCDYTGWECQSGGEQTEASSLEWLIVHALGDSDRSRLADVLPEEFGRLLRSDDEHGVAMAADWLGSHEWML